MSHQKSEAARFNEAFERAEAKRERAPQPPDRHPSIHQFRAIENGGGKSFAAVFRGIFEEALERSESGIPASREAPKLAYYEKGRPVIIDIEGIKKYVYSNGSIDMGSKVSPEVEKRAFEIGSIATEAERIVEEVPETDMARIGAADLYGLYGQELDEFLARGAETQATSEPISIEPREVMGEQPQAQAA